MSTDDEQLPVPLEPSQPVSALEVVFADPETLVLGLRQLRERIPELVVLEARDRRGMANAAHLDPEIIDIGIQAAGAWPRSKDLLGRSGDELREDLETIRRWDEVEREIRALAQGIADANLKRKFALGETILRLYKVLPPVVRGTAESYLRPYYDEMKRLYMKTRGRGRKKNQKD